MVQQLQPLKESYYEYVAKVPTGLQIMLRILRQQQHESLFNNLANLTEGLEALLIIEQALLQDGYQSKGRLKEAIAIIEAIIPLVEAQSFEQLEQPFNELSAIFSSATEWTFVKK